MSDVRAYIASDHAPYGLQDGVAGEASVLYGQFGGTGKLGTLFPTMDAEQAKAYARKKLDQGDVYEDRADADLILGCSLLATAGECQTFRCNKVTTWTNPIPSTPYTPEVVDRWGLKPGERRIDKWNAERRADRKTHDAEGFLVDDAGEFSQEGL